MLRSMKFIRNVKLPAFSTANVAADLVKQLREQTGAGMMDCKKALKESDGDMTRALDWLKKKGLKAAATQMTREAKEGVIGLLTKGNRITIVEINSETDFVARNNEFQAFATLVTTAANAFPPTGPVDIPTFMGSASGDKVMSDRLLDAITMIRENIVIRRIINLDLSSTATTGLYMHGRINADTASNVQVYAISSTALICLIYIHCTVRVLCCCGSHHN